MAEFCRECAILMGFPPEGDFIGLVKDPHTLAVVICEGCGPIYVDHEGRCVTEDCMRPPHGHRSPRQQEYIRRTEEGIARRSGPWGPLWRLRDRLLGTDWEPGLIHEIRFRYYDAQSRFRCRVLGKHWWNPWFRNGTGNEDGFWEERECIDCGKRETRDVE